MQRCKNGFQIFMLECRWSFSVREENEMKGNEGRRIHPDEEDVNKGVPDFGDFMKSEQSDPANDERVDLSSLLSEIRRVPSQPAKHSAAPVQKPSSAPAPQVAAPAPSGKQETDTKQEVQKSPASTPASSQPVSHTPVRSKVGEAEEASSDETETPVRTQTPARHLSPEERARRKAIIEAKRRKATIMLAVSAVLIVIAIGLGIFFIAKTLSSSKNSKKETSSSSASSSTSVLAADTRSSSTTEQTTTESTTVETTPSPTPTPAVTPFPAGGPNLAGYCVVIDPGHQAVPNREQEEMSSSMGGSKDKSAKGFSGVVSGIDESEINLETALLLKAYLESLGCEVYITRETNDVDISNKERAELAVSYDPDVYIRLFCNYANDSKTSGLNVIVPTGGKYAEQAVEWGDKLGEFITGSCGTSYNGCLASGNYTGLNWASSVPSFMVRMGYLSNSDEETNLLTESYQYKICEGIAQFVAFMPNH